MDKINILGVNLTKAGRQEVLKKIDGWLTAGGSHQIVTPNPEIILAAIGHDEELFYILNKADLAVPDGVALKFAAWLLGKNIIRITGADLTVEILRLAENNNKKVMIFNWRGGLSKAAEIKSAIIKKFPGLELQVEDIERAVSADLAGAKQFSPDVIFSTLGAPDQEKFIFHALPNLPTAKIGLGVGGSFDFLTGKLPRAPLWLRTIGLEWLWRLIKQPKRWRRIYNAVIVFPYKFLLWRFILPRFYRENVACLLYQRENDKFKILIVERADSTGHWQLPQGGVDGQDIMSAGARELSEEINTDKFKPVAAFAKLHQYEFGNLMGKFMVPAKKVRGYRGQKQSLFIAEFLGADADIKVNFWEHAAWRWVEAEKLVAEVHPVRRASAKIFMDKFNEFVISTPHLMRGRNL